MTSRITGCLESSDCVPNTTLSFDLRAEMLTMGLISALALHTHAQQQPPPFCPSFFPTSTEGEAASEEAVLPKSRQPYTQQRMQWLMSEDGAGETTNTHSAISQHCSGVIMQ